MNERALAISILQRARDTLGERLTQRIIESQYEIQTDAEGGSYLSEIEALYDQLGGRLAHLNAMLSNLPPVASPAPADAMASEIIYADLASAYPTGLDLEAAAPPPLLGLPAPASSDASHPNAVSEGLQNIAMQVQAGDMTSAARGISELFDVKPSDGRRCARTFSRQLITAPDLASRFAELGWTLNEVNELTAATLFGECFEFHSIEALAIVRALKLRHASACESTS